MINASPEGDLLCLSLSLGHGKWRYLSIFNRKCRFYASFNDDRPGLGHAHEHSPLSLFCARTLSSWDGHRGHWLRPWTSMFWKFPAWEFPAPEEERRLMSDRHQFSHDADPLSLISSHGAPGVFYRLIDLAWSRSLHQLNFGNFRAFPWEVNVYSLEIKYSIVLFWLSPPQIDNLIEVKVPVKENNTMRFGFSTRAFQLLGPSLLCGAAVPVGIYGHTYTVKSP